jgi:DNA repair photolyase
MGLYGGVPVPDRNESDATVEAHPEWGEWLQPKANAIELLREAGIGGKIARASIYYSPITDPYQPVLVRDGATRRVLETLIEFPPERLVVQTRSPLVLEDVELLRKLGERCVVGVSFSLTTDREDVRQVLEPKCARLAHRLQTIRALRDAGVIVFCTIAPILPSGSDALVKTAKACDNLVRQGVDAGRRDLVMDPLHIRARKRQGATTWSRAVELCESQGWGCWLSFDFQNMLTSRMCAVASDLGVSAGVGEAGFGLLTAFEGSR